MNKLNRVLLLSILLIPFIYKYVSWYDEFIVLLLGLMFFRNIKQHEISRNEKRIIYCIISIGVIGFSSNVMSHLVHNPLPCFIDFFTLFKPILIYVFSRYIFTESDKDWVVNKTKKLCSIYLLVSCILSFVSQFVNVGIELSEEVRMGIRSYSYPFNDNMYPITVLLSIIILQYKTEKRPLWPLIIGSLCILFHVKGTFLIFLIYLAFSLLILKGRSMKISHFFVLIPIIIYLSSYQMTNYINNEDSIRMMFFYYAIVTANQYLPLGAGFATYGTNEAAVNYSPLYYKYGFNQMWGMGEDEQLFLNDTYFAGIIGETGYIGAFLFVVVLFLLIKEVFKLCKYDSKFNAVLIGSFLCLMASTSATGIFKSASGVFFMCLMGVFLNNSNIFVNVKNT